MCGRYVLVDDETGIGAVFFYWQDLTREQWDQLFRDGKVMPVRKSYNISPTTMNPIVTAGPDGERRLELARWGLIPNWWKESSPPKFATFNARDDKLDSGTWRSPVRRSRCLVPANGFYEWTGPKSNRIPHFIHKPRKDGRPELIAFAGLADTWTNADTGEAVRSYTIVTTAPNKFMEPIHDRMPVILQDPETWTLWLDLRTTSLDGVKHLIQPQEWEGFAEHVVAPLKGDGPELVAAVG
jgi:putative SOS response-associated peptidase YedK